MKALNFIFSALFMAIGILLPVVFLQFGMSGSVFLPMHIPVLLTGFLLGEKEGLLVGLATPLLSSLMMGSAGSNHMLMITVLELACYGFLAGILYKRINLNIFTSILLTMLLSQLFVALTVFMMGKIFGFNLDSSSYVISAIYTGLPGIVMQLILIPLLIKPLERNLIT